MSGLATVASDSLKQQALETTNLDPGVLLGYLSQKKRGIPLPKNTQHLQNCHGKNLQKISARLRGQEAKKPPEDKAGIWPKLGNFLMGVANGLSIWWALGFVHVAWLVSNISCLIVSMGFVTVNLQNCHVYRRFLAGVWGMGSLHCPFLNVPNHGQMNTQLCIHICHPSW